MINSAKTGLCIYDYVGLYAGSYMRSFSGMRLSSWLIGPPVDIVTTYCSYCFEFRSAAEARWRLQMKSPR